MKKFMITIAAMTSYLGFGQPSTNLVSNGSFENYNTCPTSYGQVTYASQWQKSLVNNSGPTTWDHTDYFNSCSTVANFNTPNNVWGSETPADGQAYMGMTMMYNATNYGPDYRENIYTKLTSALVVGTPYYVSFSASLADNFDRAANNIGIKFATSTNFPVNNTAHLITTVPITNANGWTTIQGIFVADNAYTHIGIGNFFDDANTTEVTVCPGCGIDANLYYLDNIKVYKVCEWIDSLNTDTIIDNGRVRTSMNTGPNMFMKNDKGSSDVFMTFPSPTKNNLNIVYNYTDTKGEMSVDLLNKEGMLVKSMQIGNKSSHTFALDLSEVSPGIYFCNLKCNGVVVKSQKVIKE